MISSLVLLIQLLSLSSLVFASHYYGGTATFTAKGRNPDGSIRVDIRYKTTYDGCYYNNVWPCYSGNCGNTVNSQRGQIDYSTNAPHANRQWCESETVLRRNVPSNKPFSLRSPANCPRSYNLMDFDPDGDQVRCRYGIPGTECSTCSQPAGFQLDEGSCTLSYGHTSEGVYGFELVVEDFPTSYITLSYTDGSVSSRSPLSLRRRKRQNAYTTTTIPWWWTGTTTTAALPTTAGADPTTTAADLSTTTWQTTTTAGPTTTTEYPTTTTADSTTTTAGQTTTTPTPTTTTWQTTTTADPTTTTADSTTTTWQTTTTAAIPTTAAADPTTTAADPTTTTADLSTTTWQTTTTAGPTTTTEYPTTTTEYPTTTTADSTTTTAGQTTTTPTPTTTTWQTTTTADPTTTIADSTTTTWQTTSPWWWETTTTAALPTTAAADPTTTSADPTTTTWQTTTTAGPTTTTEYPTTTTADPTTSSADPTTTTWQTTTTADPATTTWQTTTTEYTTTIPWQTTTTDASSTTTDAPTTSTADPTTRTTNAPPSLSKLPLQFSFLVDPPAPSCSEGVYLPRFLHPTPRNGQHLKAEVNKELEIRVKAQSTNAILQNIIISGPLNITKTRNTNDEFVIRWSPVSDDLGEHFPICFIVEAAAWFVSTWASIYQSEMRCVVVEVVKDTVKANVICAENTITIEVNKSTLKGISPDHLRLSDPSNTVCSLQRYSNSTHIIGIIPLNACGTQIEEDDENLIFKNEITTFDNVNDVITRKNLLELQFYCQYSKKGNVTLSFTAHRNNVTVSEKGFGTFTYNFEFFHSNAFRAIYDPITYPLEYDVGEKIYFAIEATSTVNNTQLFVESCRAAPYDNPNYRPVYPIIENGCKVDTTLEIYNPNHLNEFRFGLEAFKFIGMHDQVYISCSVILCQAGNPNTRCAQGCINPTSAGLHRGKREAAIQTGLHLVSQGPLRLRRTAESTGTYLNMNMVFIAGCLLAVVAMLCGVIIYKSRASKVKYQPLPSTDMEDMFS